MSSFSITDLPIPRDYGFVLLAASAAAVLNQAHGFLTGHARKAARMPYPTPYAPLEAQKTSQEAYTFNCAVRAHANFTENVPTFLATLLLSGLRFPLTAAVLGAAWVAARAVYAAGYYGSKLGDGGKGRMKGTAFFVPQVLLMGLTFVAGGLVLVQ